MKLDCFIITIILVLGVGLVNAQSKIQTTQTPTPICEFTLNLDDGWNFVSFPVIDPNFDEVMNKNDLKIYEVSGKGYRYVEAKAITPLAVYWVYNPGPQLNITFKGSPSCDGKIKLTKGWAGFGVPYNGFTKGQLEEFQKIGIKEAYKYDTNSKAYVQVKVDSLEPGEGYFIESPSPYEINIEDVTSECEMACLSPYPPHCGNNVIEEDYNETCDPPRSLYPDTSIPCRDDCTYCGDNITQEEWYEECDPPNGVDCSSVCTVISKECGDNITRIGLNETCDPPGTLMPNNNTCRDDCTYCGDNIIQILWNETCDGEDYCREDCTYCGDNIIQILWNETCDGEDYCREDCTYCGDGNIDGHFEWRVIAQPLRDSGGKSRRSIGYYLIDAPIRVYIEWVGEGCDPLNDPDCRDDCTKCGDNITQTRWNETCDGQPWCRDDCGFCGDGIVNGDEECDDGNKNNLDLCLNDCTLAYCGDGYVQEGLNESCDPLNDPDCHDDCTKCGDNITQTRWNETCDGEDFCRDDCTYCGDNITQEEYETCDDGNLLNDDGCSENCLIECEDTIGLQNFDIMLVVDRSSSMGEDDKLAKAINASNTFISFLNPHSDQIGLVSFNFVPTLNSGLTSNYSRVLYIINHNLFYGGSTTMSSAISMAKEELNNNGRPDAIPIMILLSDSGTRYPDRAPTINNANIAKSDGITIYTIGLGSDVDESFLLNVSSGPDYYFYSPVEDVEDIVTTYLNVFRDFYHCCGNGELNEGEACDPNIDGMEDYCREDCTYCGDGEIQEDYNETCEPPNTPDCDEECHIRPL